MDMTEQEWGGMRPKDILWALTSIQMLSLFSTQLDVSVLLHDKLGLSGDICPFKHIQV